MTAAVLVGVDGSAPSLHAARHAALAARRLGAPLLLLHAWSYPYTDSPGLLPPLGLDDAAQRVADTAARTLRKEYPDLHIEARTVAGSPGGCLIYESATAALTVVGGRGGGGFAELLLGSVASQVAAHAHGPVLVVRGDSPLEASGAVVVGVDGSPGNRPAIAVAAGEADRRALELQVLFAWWADSFVFPLTATFEQVEKEALTAAETIVTDAVTAAAQAQPAITVTPRLEHSLNPEHTLIEASKNAALVVVGSRGRGGFRGLLLGSASQALVHHAACPVLVVHPNADEPG